MGNTVGTTREIDYERERMDALFKFIRSDSYKLPDEFKNDKTFIIDAINIGIGERFVCFIPQIFDDDDEIFEAIVNNNIVIPITMLHKITSEENALKLFSKDNMFNKYSFLNETLQHDKSFALKVLSKCPYEYKSMPREIRFDEEVELEAIKLRGTNLCYASRAGRCNRELVKLAIDNNPHALEFASEELRDDYEIVTNAMKKDLYTLTYASKRLINDHGLLKKILRANSNNVCIQNILRSVEKRTLIELFVPFIKLFKEKPYLIAYLDDSVFCDMADIIFNEIPILTKYVRFRDLFPAQTVTITDNSTPTTVAVRKRNKN